MTIGEAIQSLTNRVLLVCPIVGVCISDINDKATWRIDFDTTATDAQKAAAQAVVAGFDPLALPVPSSVMMWRVKAVLALPKWNKLATIDAYIASQETANTVLFHAWIASSEILRNSPMVIALGANFGIPPDDLDLIFREAEAISI